MRTRSRRAVRFLTCFALALTLHAAAARPVRAWDTLGHWTVALMAYNDLGNTPLRARLVQILRQHPIYPTAWRPRTLHLPDEGAGLFMLASSWPDDIKSDSHYWLPGMTQSQISQQLNPQHYVDYPYVPPQQHVTGPSPSGPTLLSGLTGNLQTLHNGPTDADRAVALCWILHLMGDAHQPLHCVSKFTDRQPHGDAGANFDWLRVTVPAPHPTAGHPTVEVIAELHAVWDNMLDPVRLAQPSLHPDFPQAMAFASSLATAFPRASLPNVGQGDLQTWTQDSKQVAITTAYLNNGLTYTPTQSFADPHPTQAPPPPGGYLSSALGVARMRMAMAGYRTADLLRHP